MSAAFNGACMEGISEFGLDESKTSGGIDENGEKKRLESLNFETMEWTRLGDMFTERSDCACTTFKDDLIVAGLLLRYSCVHMKPLHCLACL